jgi:transposase
MTQEPNKTFEAEKAYNRNFSEEFKRSKVKDINEKKISIPDLCRLYNVSRTSVYKWIYLYSAAERGVKTVVQMDSEALKVKEQAVRIAELERIVGIKQMIIDYQDKLIEFVSEEVGYDVKKKHKPEPSNTLKNSNHTPNSDSK